MAKKSFDFGKNWRYFIKKYFNQERLIEAIKSLKEFSNGYNLTGKSFIDVGCGSGLFSLAAYKLGASKIISFDIDKDSVNCCTYLREIAGNPPYWKVINGSILDENFLKKLEKYDVVYSWGVLHHTGNIWKALENTINLVAESGLLYIAIYNKSNCVGFYPDGRFGTSNFWRREKYIYSQLPSLLQDTINNFVMISLIFMYLLTLKNPISKIQSHKILRGMSWKIDIKDWLGGFPYEYASIDEVFNFVRKFGFSLINLRGYNGLGNNEYIFKKINIEL